MPDTTDRHLTIGDAETALHTAMRFHARQAECYAEYGDGTDEDRRTLAWHRECVRKLGMALECLIGANNARASIERAWRLASREVTGD